MSQTNSSIRIRTNISSDKKVEVDLEQDFDIVEILSLKIRKTDLYKLHTSHYGCIAGRVLANGAVGVPNAKVSVFISADTINDISTITDLYPYSSAYSRNEDGILYNLLPDEQVSECHTPIGSMPSKRMTLDDNTIIEVFDKYYKFTTRTNKSGDYMLFGIDTGSQMVHVDIDLSDIGFLSQKPYDMIYKGYDSNLFENPKKFKGSTDIKNLAQVITQTDSVDVYPFWGENENEDTTDKSYDTVKITRHDIEISYKIEPTCVFFGSLVTDPKGQGFSKKCIPSKEMGKMDRLVTGAGTIEMIRKKIDGSVESFSVSGDELIDSDGTWCYQIPMNLDYVATDEYGNIVPTDNPEKGIPTRARVRFRISLTDYDSDRGDNHLVKMLVPNNPDEYEDLDYNFGSYTLDNEEGSSSFRDLFTNNVYTIKSYIPRIQKSADQDNLKFSGFKDVNVYGSNNPIPYNNMRMKMTFMFVLQCCMARMMLWVLKLVNQLLSWIIYKKIVFWRMYPNGVCLFFGDGICPDLEGWYFAPGCSSSNNSGRPWKNTWNRVKKQYEGDEKSTDYQNKVKLDRVCLTNTWDYLVQCVEINLAQEYNLIQFDFYNDWINGLVYIPRWFADIKKKKSYKVGSLREDGALYACGDNNNYDYMKLMQQCTLAYSYDNDNEAYTKVTTSHGCGSTKLLGFTTSAQRCHKSQGRDWTYILDKRGGTYYSVKNGGGIIHQNETLNGTNVFYMKPCEWHEGTEQRKVLLFATDIVLLGSLNEENGYSIPSYFSDLEVTTYVMPSNLASTNMDSEGYLYGFGGASVCNNQKIEEPMEVIDDTFDNYDEWSKTTSVYSKKTSATTDYAVTETAGIDWGYAGPGQKKYTVNGINNLDTLYFPGGHFLGISCLNAQVNIKSCVNLSRICELGAQFSQRKAFYNKVNDKITFSYMMPTGLISKNEINDSNFRDIFATLNFNHLKTVKDKTTNYNVYDFIPCKPKNFAGNLESIVTDNEDYNKSDSIIEPYENRSEKKALVYRRTPETFDREYYLFRLGLPYNATKKDMAYRYQDKEGGSVSMPTYENSFYFYFGINNGNTALNRFLTDFTGECTSIDESVDKYQIDITNETFCNSKDPNTGDGEIKITFNNVESPYSASLLSGNTQLYIAEDDDTKEIYVTNSSSKGVSNFVFTESSITITQVNTGDYTLTLSASDGIVKKREITVGYDFPDFVKYAGINVTAFEETNVNIDPQKMLSSMFEYTLLDDDEVTDEIKNASKSKSELPTATNSNSDRYINIGNEYYVLENNTSGGGTINILLGTEDVSVIGYIIASDEKYMIISYDQKYVEQYESNKTNNIDEYVVDGKKCIFSYIDSEIDLYDFTTRVWKGNEDYFVYALYTCPTGVYSILLNKANVSMPIDLDVYIGDTDVLYNQHILTYMGMRHPEQKFNSRWFRFLLDEYGDINDTVALQILSDAEYEKLTGSAITASYKNKYKDTYLEITPKMIWQIRHALTYDVSIWTDEEVSREIYATGGTPPYSYAYIGSPEWTGTNDDEDETDDDDDYTLKGVPRTEKIYANTELPDAIKILSGGSENYVNIPVVSSSQGLSYTDFFLPTKGFSTKYLTDDCAKIYNYQLSSKVIPSDAKIFMLTGSTDSDIGIKEYTYDKKHFWNYAGMKNDYGLYVTDSTYAGNVLGDGRMPRLNSSNDCKVYLSNESNDGFKFRSYTNYKKDLNWLEKYLTNKNEELKDKWNKIGYFDRTDYSTESNDDGFPSTWASNCFIKLPSFYRPFYFNSCVCIHPYVKKVHFSITVVNPISYLGKVCDITIKTNSNKAEYTVTGNTTNYDWDISTVVKKYPSTVSSDTRTIDYYYVKKESDNEIEYSKDMVNKYDITVAEAHPEGYDNLLGTKTITDTLNFAFYEDVDEPMSKNARYFWACSNSYTNGVNGIIDTGNTIHTDFFTYREDYYKGSGFISVDSFEYQDEIKVSTILEQGLPDDDGNFLSWDDLLTEGNKSKFGDINYTNYYATDGHKYCVIGISDIVSRSSGDDGKYMPRDGMYTYAMAKHTNLSTAVRVYETKEFFNIVKKMYNENIV